MVKVQCRSSWKSGIETILKNISKLRRGRQIDSEGTSLPDSSGISSFGSNSTDEPKVLPSFRGLPTTFQLRKRLTVHVINMTWPRLAWIGRGTGFNRAILIEQTKKRIRRKRLFPVIAHNCVSYSRQLKEFIYKHRPHLNRCPVDKPSAPNLNYGKTHSFPS